MLELYREALARRRELAGAPFAWLDDAEETLSFARGHVVCTVNAASDDIPRPGGELLLASEPGLQDMLPPDTAAWVRTTDDERSALR
jgi:alpha-glucosidase